MGPSNDVKVIAIDLEQHFLDYGKVAKGRSPLNLMKSLPGDGLF